MISECGSKGLALDRAPLDLFSGEIQLGLIVGGALDLVIGVHHASYRAIPERSLLLLPTLWRALFGDLFAAIEEPLCR
jgi:hypothetical protein